MKKAVLPALFVLLGVLPLLAQVDYIEEKEPILYSGDKMPDAIMQGKLDGERDGKGNIPWGLAGFGCGCLGFGAAVLYDPKPNQALLVQMSQEKGTDYAVAYQKAYTKKAKTQNCIYAGIGWVVWSAVYLTTIYPEQVE